MPSVWGKSLEELPCGYYPEKSMVLGVQDGVGPERLRDVFVKVGGEWEVRIQVEH